jgi:hypothetical protein
MIVFDQKEDTKRCGQTVAAHIVDATPALDNRVITADALHCQRKVAWAIVEKGGEYVLQVKGNQPQLEERPLHVFATNGMALDFPYARSVVVVRSQRTVKRTQKTTHETRYYVSSLDPEERKPEEW